MSEMTFHYIPAILISHIGIAGLVLNGLVIAAILLRKTLRSNYTNILIVNQALANFLLILFDVPFLATTYAMDFVWLFGKYCSAWWYLRYACNYASLYTLVLLSADRFLITFYPVSTKSIRSVRNTVAAILVLWVLVLACCVPIIFVFQIANYFERDYCVFSSNKDEYGEHVLTFSTVSTSFFVPLTIMAALFVPTIVRLCRNRNYSTIEDDQKGYTILVVSWFIAFIICNTPNIAAMLHYVVSAGNVSAGSFFRFLQFTEILMNFAFCVYPTVYIVMWKCFHRFAIGQSELGLLAPPQPMEMRNAETVQLATNVNNCENIG